jgi:arylformamidase
MIISFSNGKKIDISKGIDCSIPLSASDTNPRAWYVDPPVMEPVRANGWIGAVNQGGSVNFRNIFFNPHGHGTHTECLGHITNEIFSINSLEIPVFMEVEVVSILPQEVLHTDGLIDKVIRKNQLKERVTSKKIEALIIRTLPNDETKKTSNYSDTNPPYLEEKLVEFLNELGVKHLLVDLPSVDREKDNGLLAFHHSFWGVPTKPDYSRTITELCYVPSSLVDGTYYLNLQTAPFENDATPSRPVLFKPM